MASINRRRLWLLFGAGLLLHGVLDPIVTYLVVVQAEAGHEANPLMRGSLAQGPLYFAATHLLLYAVTIGCFAGVMWLLRTSSGRAHRQVHALANIVLVGIIIWGLIVVGWNLSVLWG